MPETTRRVNFTRKDRSYRDGGALAGELPPLAGGLGAGLRFFPTIQRSQRSQRGGVNGLCFRGSSLASTVAPPP